MACRINFKATSDVSAKLFQSCQNMSEIKFDEIVQNFLSPQNWYRTRVMKYRPIFVRLQTAVNYILAVRMDIKPIRLRLMPIVPSRKPLSVGFLAGLHAKKLV